MHLASLASPCLRNGRPQCRSHSRLSKEEQTFNIFGVNTHTHLRCLRAAPAIARRVRNRPATCLRRSCAISSPVPSPSDTARRVGPAVVQVAPNLTLEQCRDALRPRRAFSHQPPPGSLPSHATFGAYPFARLPKRSSLRFLAADTVRAVASHSLLEHHHHRLVTVYTRSLPTSLPSTVA